MSAPPVKYVKSTDYAATPSLNVDFDRIVSTTGQTIDRLAEIQRDDGKLRDSAITTNSLADKSVTEPKLADLSVSTRTLQDGSVTGPKLAPGSVPPSAIQPGSIGSVQLQDGGVQTVDLSDLSVTQQKLSLLSVGTPQLIDASVTPAKLSPATISAFAPAAHTHPESDVVNLIVDLALKAPLASPALSGIPTAPTPATGTNTTQLATTAFVAASMSAAGAITEAPNDGALYGRQALGWQLGVKKAGDTMTGPLVVPGLTSADHTPGANILSSLGSAALRWLKVWAKDADLSGDLTVAGNITGNLPGVPNRNLVINGDCIVDQRHNYLPFTLGGVGLTSDWIADRWQAYARALANNISADIQCYHAGSPSAYVLRYNVNTATLPVDVTDYSGIQYSIEGFDFSDALWGTPSAKPITISFVVQSNVIGTYGITMVNAANDRYFVASYTINAANVWETKTITIPGCTDSTWDYGNLKGLRLWWDLGTGASQCRAVTAAWTVNGGGFVAGMTGGQKIWGAAGNKFLMGKIKVEFGSVATPFVPDTFEVSLAKCQRYYLQLDYTQYIYTHILGVVTGATAGYAAVPFPVAMRAGPALAVTNLSWIAQDGNAAWGITAFGLQAARSLGASLTITTPGGMTVGRSFIVQSAQAGTSSMKFDAEL